VGSVVESDFIAAYRKAVEQDREEEQGRREPGSREPGSREPGSE